LPQTGLGKALDEAELAAVRAAAHRWRLELDAHRLALRALDLVDDLLAVGENSSDANHRPTIAMGEGRWRRLPPNRMKVPSALPTVGPRLCSCNLGGPEGEVNADSAVNRALACPGARSQTTGGPLDT